MQSVENLCPKCRAMRVKSWDELSRDEEIVAERLPASAEYSPAERKKHRFCTRCWFEEKEPRSSEA